MSTPLANVVGRTALDILIDHKAKELQLAHPGCAINVTLSRSSEGNRLVIFWASPTDLRKQMKKVLVMKYMY